VGWKHSYEVWIDANKDSHRRDVARKKVNVATAKSDCDDRRVREARAEYYSLTGQDVGTTLAGSEVGFRQSKKRYKHGYMLTRHHRPERAEGEVSAT